MARNYSLDKETGLLECYVYSVKSEDVEKSRKFTEQLGIDSKEKIYGEPMQICIDLTRADGVSYFLPNKTELYEEGNFVDGTYLEFSNGLNFVLLIEYNRFKALYKEYIAPVEEEKLSVYEKLKRWLKKIVSTQK